MRDEKAAARIAELEARLREANRQYYELDAPTISDAQYDSLFRELEALEQQYPQLANADSPTNKVGSRNSALESVLEERGIRSAGVFSEVRHREPMLSLQNAMDATELLEFSQRTAKLLAAGAAELEYVVESKFDGLAIELVYQHGSLVLAATRGDGEVGEDVTENVRTIKSVPKTIKNKSVPELFEVRGEVVLNIADFKRLNLERIEAGEPPFANPRNAAAGSVRQLDSKVSAARPLEFFAYALASPTALEFRTQAESLELLRSFGFQVQPDVLVTQDIAQILARYQKLELERESLAYEIDGLVVKVNSLLHQSALGIRSRSPRWAVALKFAPREEFTVLRDITVQVGRTGTLTPVAELEPVQIGGVVVRRATLHNQEEIDRKDIRIGDTVVVRRQGDVIPAVVSVVTSKRTGAERRFLLPDLCPVCQGKVERENEQDVALRCVNLQCPAKRIERLKHFVSRTGFDIESLGEKLLEQLLATGKVKSAPDLFLLSVADLMSLERMGEKSAQNVVLAIDRRRKIAYWRFLYALGIRHVGEQTAKALASFAQPLSVLMAMSLEDLQTVPDIGPKVAQTIFSFFRDESERGEIMQLQANGVDIEYPEQRVVAQAGPFSGELVVLTGTLQSLTREEAKARIEALGGSVGNAVSKKTTLLVAGEKSGSKLKQAESLGIAIVDEDEFLKRLSAVSGV